MKVAASRTDRGVVAVETALLLPLFLMFWFGIVDWGITFWAHQTIVYRANMAARWGVVNTWNPTSIRNLVVYGDVAGTGSALFSLSAQGNDDGTGTNVDVTLRCLTRPNPSSPDLSLASGSTCLAASNDGRDDRSWIEIVVHDYTWTHFTPGFSGSYTGRQVTVSLPVEGLGAT